MIAFAVVVFLGSWVNSLLPALNWMLVSVVAVVVTTPLLLRGVVVSTVWAFILFTIEAVGLIVLSIVLLALAGGHIGDPFTNLGGSASGLSGLALAFPIAISGFVGWENSGALAEETKNPRRDIQVLTPQTRATPTPHPGEVRAISRQEALERHPCPPPS